MRVALLTNFIPPYRAPLFQALSKRVGALRVFLSTRMEPNRAWPAQWESIDVEIQKTLTLRRTWRHPYGFEEPLFVHLPYDTLPSLTRFRPRVVLSAEMGLRSLQAALYARATGAKFIIWATLSEHTEQGRGKLRPLLRRMLLRLADAVIVNGESGARYVRSLGLPDSRLRRIPQTTQIAPFMACSLDRKPEVARRILYVGRLIELKNLVAFTSELAAWAEENPAQRVSFWLVGDGELRETILATPHPANLELRCTGNVPYEDLPGFYAQGGILTLPTHADEWGLVVNEAMAAGLPILGSLHSQAVEELVVDGETGWTFDPAKQGQMRDAIRRAMATPPARIVQMRAKARERVSALTPDEVASRLAGVFAGA